MAAPDRPPDWLPEGAPETPPRPPINLIEVEPRPSGGRLWVEVEGGTHPHP